MGLRRCLMLATVWLFAFGSFALRAEKIVQRGKYLVDEVAKCGDCHTPKLDGKPDRSKWLKGASVDFAPAADVDARIRFAPAITSELLERWKEADLKKFLQTGLRPSGESAHAPMPAYKLRPDDADAVVEYLKSLK